MSISNLSEHFCVIDLGATLIGCIRNDGGAVLIDSGLEARQAQKLDKLLQTPVTAVYHTHSHADHIGGSAYFHEKHGAAVYMPAAEISLTAMPLLEGALLYGGMSPAALRNKFFLAEPVPSAAIPQEPFEALNIPVTPLPLHGHSPAHTGYMIEGCAFLGDSVLTSDVITKHGVLYMFDPEASLNTLDYIDSLDFSQAVLCHKGCMTKAECAEHTACQRHHIHTIFELTRQFSSGTTADDIAIKIAEHMNINLNTGIYLLILSSIKGYLYTLVKRGEVAEEFAPARGIIYTKK